MKNLKTIKFNDIYDLYVKLEEYIIFNKFQKLKYKSILDENNIDYEIRENKYEFISKDGISNSYVFDQIITDIQNIEKINNIKELSTISYELDKFKEKIGIVNIPENNDVNNTIESDSIIEDFYEKITKQIKIARHPNNKYHNDRVRIIEKKYHSGREIKKDDNYILCHIKQFGRKDNVSYSVIMAHLDELFTLYEIDYEYYHEKRDTSIPMIKLKEE